MRITKKRIILILLVICVTAGVLGRTVAVRGVFNESDAVTFAQFSSSHTIEDSTLFIGTHLIYSQALTDELYEKALESASESGQSNVYYKSELAGGVWFDITDASGLAEISTAGVIVDESELADLWVTHYTDSSGITRDAGTGMAVSIFDTPDPYDLYNLPELESIRMQYDNVYNSDSTGVNRYYYNTLRDFFQLNVRNDITNECDRQLTGLQTCYETLLSQDETELAEIVSTLMSRIDARRRAEVFNQLSQIDDNELDRLQTRCSGSNYDSDDYDEEQFVESANITDAIGLAMEKCEESYTEHTGKMLEEGTTVLKNVEYEDSMQVVNMSAGGYDSSMQPVLLELRDLYHIQDDVIANQEQELSLLNSKLLSRVSNKYAGAISSGANGTYLAAVSSGASEAARGQLLEDQKVEVNAIRSELQYLVQAKTKRMDSQSSVDYIYTEIDVASGYKTRIKADDFASKAGETVDAYILWLQDLARAIVSADTNMSSEMQELEARKEELQNERADALADNDLSAARLYDAMIEAVDQDMEAKQAELNAVLNNPNSSASDKARAANAAGDSSLLNNINQTKNSVLSAIADGNLDSDSLRDKIDNLAAMGAEDALKEIKDSLSGSSGASDSTNANETGGSLSGSSGASDSANANETGGSLSDSSGASDLMKALDDAIEQSKESSLHGLLNGDGSGGTGSAGSGALSEDELLDLINSIFGASFFDLDADEKAAATVAVERLGEAGNPAAADLAQDFLNQCLRDNNAYVYEKLSGQSFEYIPLKVIAHATKNRYIYSDNKREATLSSKGVIYRFVVAGQEVTFTDGSAETISAKVEMQGVPYIAEADARKYFSCEAEYIDDSNYGVCLNEKMQKLVEEIISAAMEGGE